VVVPETLEPSLQLAAAVLSELKLPDEEVRATVDQFRKKHLAELQTLARETGACVCVWGWVGVCVRERERVCVCV